jgi:alpha-tubulin suppressor-like RCC1 family protein
MKTKITLIAIAVFTAVAIFGTSIISCAQKIAGSGQHSLTVCSDSTSMAWGDNANGALGNGTNTDSNIPVHVSFLTNVTAVAGGQYHCLAINNDTVWAWGYNSIGQLGNGTNSSSNVPVQVILLN